MSKFLIALTTTVGLAALVAAFATDEAKANVATGLSRPVAAATGSLIAQTGFGHGGHHGGHFGFGHHGGHIGFSHHQHFFSHHHHGFVPYIYSQPYCYSCYRRHHHRHRHHGY